MRHAEYFVCRLLGLTALKIISQVEIEMYILGYIG